MKNFICKLSAVFIVVFASAAPVQAAKPGCNLKILVLGEAKINGYDALSGGDYVESIRLRLRNSGDAICSGILKITRTGSFDRLSGPESNFLKYTIVDPNNISQVILDPVSQQSQGLPIEVGAGDTIDILPSLRVLGGQTGRQGRYFATLNARADFGTAQDPVDQQFNVSAQVQPRVQANFVGGINGTLNLGELVPNASQSINLQIRSSADFDVGISSENKGNLVPKKGEFEIPYSMTFGGQAVDLGNGSIFNMALQEGISVQELPIIVTIGQFTNGPAGKYRDLVTVRISAY